MILYRKSRQFYVFIILVILFTFMMYRAFFYAIYSPDILYRTNKVQTHTHVKTPKRYHYISYQIITAILPEEESAALAINRLAVRNIQYIQRFFSDHLNSVIYGIFNHSPDREFMNQNFHKLKLVFKVAIPLGGHAPPF